MVWKIPKCPRNSQHFDGFCKTFPANLGHVLENCQLEGVTRCGLEGPQISYNFLLRRFSSRPVHACVFIFSLFALLCPGQRSLARSIFSFFPFFLFFFCCSHFIFLFSLSVLFFVSFFLNLSLSLFLSLSCFFLFSLSLSLSFSVFFSFSLSLFLLFFFISPFISPFISLLLSLALSYSFLLSLALFYSLSLSLSFSLSLSLLSLSLPLSLSFSLSLSHFFHFFCFFFSFFFLSCSPSPLRLFFLAFRQRQHRCLRQGFQLGVSELTTRRWGNELRLDCSKTGSFYPAEPQHFKALWLAEHDLCMLLGVMWRCPCP